MLHRHSHTHMYIMSQSRLKMKVASNSIRLSVVAHVIALCVCAPKALVQEAIRKAELSLLADVAFGRKSFAQVGRDAKTFSYAGTELQSLIFSNASAGITRRLEDVTGFSEDMLTFIKIRTQGGISPHPFSLLSDHIEREYGKDASCFDIDFSNDQAHFLTSKEYLEHPLVQLCHGTDTQVIPLSIYGDGVVVTEAPLDESIYVVYLAFLHNDTTELSLPIKKHVYTVYKKGDDGRETLDDVFKVLVWELLALQHGRKPLLGEEGKPFNEQRPGEYLGNGWGRKKRFCLMQFKGDGAFLCEALGVRGHNSMKWMCPWCRATRDGVNSWKDFSLRAAWLLTIRSHEGFLADMQTSREHKFVQGQCAFSFEPSIIHAPFFRWTYVVLDWMHCVDEGVTTYVLAEIWWSLLPHMTRIRHRSAKVVRHFGLQSLKGRLTKWYAAHKTNSRVRVHKLTLKKIKTKNTLKLKAKAAQANRLVAFTRELTEQYRSKDGELGEHRFQCMWFLERLCALSRQSVLTPADLVDWRWCSAMFLYHHIMCGHHVTPKFHWFLHFPHIIEQAGAPRSFYLYSDESKNADIKRLYKACSNGNQVCKLILKRLGWQEGLLPLL